MAKQEQALVLEPAVELHFVGPFTEVVTSYLKLTNPLERRVCFKVKTTAPKKYCVRPNSGVLEPKQVLSVAVMLQPFDYNPNEKNKHKFMVQAMIVPDGDSNYELLWRDALPENLMDSKLRCVFDMPANETIQNNNLDTNPVQGDEKISTSKVVTEPTTVKSSPKVSNHTKESELRLLADENKRLKDEIQRMKQENSQLKEEGLRLRSRANPTSEAASQLGSSSSLGGATSRGGDEWMQEQQQSPMLYLAIMLTIGLVGILLGKFIV